MKPEYFLLANVEYIALCNKQYCMFYCYPTCHLIKVAHSCVLYRTYRAFELHRISVLMRKNYILSSSIQCFFVEKCIYEGVVCSRSSSSNCAIVSICAQFYLCGFAQLVGRQHRSTHLLLAAYHMS